MLVISVRIEQKLKTKHNVTREDVLEAFSNREGYYLEDSREDHKSDPPTQWFVAETNWGVMLKVVFIQKNDETIIKTAYEANKQELKIYNKNAFLPPK